MADNNSIEGAKMADPRAADFVSSLGSYIWHMESPVESDLEVLDFAAEMLETSHISGQKEEEMGQKL